MSEGKQMLVADIAHPHRRSIAIGPFGSSLKAELYVDDGIPVVRGQNITEGHRVDESDLVFVTEETAAKFPACLLDEGDLVFPHRGAIGRVGLVGKRRMLLSSSMMKLTVDPEKADPRYVFYYFRGPGRDQLLTRASTVGTPGIGQPLKSLRGIQIRMPELDEQQAIAEVLGALDDKIAANTKLAATADSLAEWEFRRLMKEAHSRVALSDVLALEYGKALPATKRVPGAVQVYGSGGVVGSHDQAFRNGPGVIVGRKGTAGAVHWAASQYFPIDTTYWVQPVGESVSPIFAYFLLKSLRLHEMNSDSAVPGLNRNEALAISVRCPSSQELRSFTEAAMEMFDVSTQLRRENQALATTRDALLPQLMSGKLRIKDAKAILEDANA